ncbi:hypothetical protein CMALT430_90024 [Carnobacterium maltaromaticum]|uniref:hypothetical protein n=1 Tax=Carnobacterium maltaromaticum TaxID=2751 RepID=UPI00191BC104|nr:hypothetical protein [Carnobacterium maltaromaticum]CAD5900126.1 hypothetical protein CMALT394_30075 [Carnobacterium maltaromaticum]CAD5902632.1 hypothetical protein CMALT430_90024 [Carnobacterium maltaromaticum]
MRIEDYWVDRIIYNVSFIVESFRGRDEVKFKKINKTLIMPYEATTKEVTELILTRFKDVSEVTLIEEVMDGLSLKETI